MGVGDYKKASMLMNVLQRQLQAHRNKCEYVVKICNVLRVKENEKLREVANTILKLLGK